MEGSFEDEIDDDKESEIDNNTNDRRISNEGSGLRMPDVLSHVTVFEPIYVGYAVDLKRRGREHYRRIPIIVAFTESNNRTSSHSLHFLDHNGRSDMLSPRGVGSGHGRKELEFSRVMREEMDIENDPRFKLDEEEQKDESDYEKEGRRKQRGTEAKRTKKRGRKPKSEV